MVAGHTFLIEAAVERRVLGSIPVMGGTTEDYLRRPGAMSGWLTLRQATENTELIAPGARAIYLVREGAIEPEWGGLLMAANLPVGGDQVQLGGLGWLGWLDLYGPILVDRQFDGVDQFEIFATLVADAQDETVIDTWSPVDSPQYGQLVNGPGADLGITVTWDALSGVTRQRLEEYRWFAGKNLGEALRQLAALEDGFDYRMRFGVVGEQIVKSIHLSYPQQGVRNGLRWDYHGPDEHGVQRATNVAARGISRDASAMRWRLRGWGSGAGPTRLVHDAQRAEWAGIYPFYGDQRSYSSVIEADTLAENTNADLARLDHPRELPGLRVKADWDPKWGTYGIGDYCDIVVDDGWASMAGEHRIIGYAKNVDGDEPTLIFEGV